MTNTLRIHRHALSGHSHRVELFASLAGLSHQLIDVDLATGEHKKAPFLSLNPFGQVPVIEDGELVLSDANAILLYLARRYAPDWMPTGAVAEAQVQQILSLAAGDIAHGPAAARLVTVFGAPIEPARPIEVAHRVFERLEGRLADQDWLAADRPTIADVAIYSYTVAAPEGNVSLDAYPNLRAWLRRVEALPGFVSFAKTAVGLAA